MWNPFDTVQSRFFEFGTCFFAKAPGRLQKPERLTKKGVSWSRQPASTSWSIVFGVLPDGPQQAVTLRADIEKHHQLSAEATCNSSMLDQDAYRDAHVNTCIYIEYTHVYIYMYVGR